jgi:hypothetical protein
MVFMIGGANMRRLAPFLLFLAISQGAVAAPTQGDCKADGPVNAEMTRLFDADQAARKDGFDGDWDRIEAEDAQRRARTGVLIAAGALRSGTDFYHAAYIYQHGGEPDDYLKAHVLATSAVAKGRVDAAWIAAATLDRYLKAIGRSQIYGTQYRVRDGVATQEPYDRALVPDALRAVAGVPLLAEQETERAELEREAQAREARRKSGSE